jgi:hypothetical protein
MELISSVHEASTSIKLNSNLPSGSVARLLTLSSIHLSIGFAGDFADNCGRRQQLASFDLWEERVEVHSGGYDSIGRARWYRIPLFQIITYPHNAGTDHLVRMHPGRHKQTLRSYIGYFTPSLPSWDSQHPLVLGR